MIIIWLSILKEPSKETGKIVRKVKAAYSSAPHQLFVS